MSERKTKIMIIEDDEFLVKAYRLKFNRLGFQVVIASNGVEGLEIVSRESPSLIILDLMLPKMDGFEFLKRIKSDRKSKSIPVVALSNLGQKTDQEKALALGAAEYFIKTEYTLDDIVKKIKKYF
jgi:DNA-binding response OmpR family regulator